jgi:hypothetical protein
MSVGRFYQHPDQQFESMYQPMPLEFMKHVIDERQKAYDTNEALLDQLSSLKFKNLDVDKTKADEKKAWLEGLASQVYERHKGDLGRASSDILKLKREIAKEFETGSIGAMQGNYNTYHAKIKELDDSLKAGHITAQMRDKAASELNAEYKGIGNDANNWNRVNPRTTARFEDLHGDARKMANEMHAWSDEKLGAWFKEKGKEDFWQSYKVSKKGKTAEHMYPIILQMLASDSKYKSYLDQEVRWDMRSIGDNLGQFVSNTDKDIAEQVLANNPGKDMYDSEVQEQIQKLQEERVRPQVQQMLRNKLLTDPARNAANYAAYEERGISRQTHDDWFFKKQYEALEEEEKAKEEVLKQTGSAVSTDLFGDYKKFTSILESFEKDLAVLEESKKNPNLQQEEKTSLEIQYQIRKTTLENMKRTKTAFDQKLSQAGLNVEKITQDADQVFNDHINHAINKGILVTEDKRNKAHFGYSKEPAYIDANGNKYYKNLDSFSDPIKTANENRERYLKDQYNKVKNKYDNFVKEGGFSGGFAPQTSDLITGKNIKNEDKLKYRPHAEELTRQVNENPLNFDIYDITGKKLNLSQEEKSKLLQTITITQVANNYINDEIQIPFIGYSRTEGNKDSSGAKDQNRKGYYITTKGNNNHLDVIGKEYLKYGKTEEDKNIGKLLTNRDIMAATKEFMYDGINYQNIPMSIAPAKKGKSHKFLSIPVEKTQTGGYLIYDPEGKSGTVFVSNLNSLNLALIELREAYQKQ